MPLSEIDIVLPKLSNFENNSKYEKIINESYILNKKLYKKGQKILFQILLMSSKENNLTFSLFLANSITDFLNPDFANI